ncbi:MAG: hypothetical protein AAGE88_18260 [Actinomycetota bacterium]
MEITIDLALAERIAGHLLDVLSSDEGQLNIPNLRVGQAQRDLEVLFEAIVAANDSE